MDISQLKSLSKISSSRREEYYKTRLTTMSEEECFKSNHKLAYNADILVKSLTEQMENFNSFGFNLVTGIRALVNEAIISKYPQQALPNCNIVTCNNAKFGHYSVSDPIVLTKKLMIDGKTKSPKEVANELVDAIPDNDLFEKIIAADNGFLNVTIKHSFMVQIIGDILKNGVKPPGYLKKVVAIDFSSPNIAKEMHVGHLRSTIIGESLARVMEFIGWDVHRINHVGDWGTHFGMLIAHLEEISGGLDKPIPPITDLQVFYKESKKRFDEDEIFKKSAYERVVALQNNSCELVRNAWKNICDLSRKEFNKIYNLLDVRLEEMGESFYQSRMMEVVNELREKGMVKEENGCKLVFVNCCSAPLFLQKSDGGFTYDTSDLATIKYRLYEIKADALIYVVDSGQSEHLSAIYEAAQMAGWYRPEEKRVEHVGFGVVLGPDKKKFKTRSGDTVKLIDLLQEGVRRAHQKLSESERFKNTSQELLTDASQAVAFACIRYADLSHTRTLDYVFTFDKMLEDKGNTAVYLLYTYTRIRSIQRRCEKTENCLKEYFLQQNGIILKTAKDENLALKICQFTETVARTTDKMMPHFLCEYVYFLAQDLNDYYESFHIIEKHPETGEIASLDMDRLILVSVAAKIIEKVFSLLGIRPLEQM